MEMDCPFCAKKFDKDELRYHTVRNHPEQLLSSAQLSTPKVSDTDFKFFCHQLFDPSTLNKMVKETTTSGNSGIPPLSPCAVCKELDYNRIRSSKKAYAWTIKTRKLKAHLLDEHLQILKRELILLQVEGKKNKVKSWSCWDCGADFKRKSSWYHHRKRVHLEPSEDEEEKKGKGQNTTVGRAPCEYCGRQFTSSEVTHSTRNCKERRKQLRAALRTVKAPPLYISLDLELKKDDPPVTSSKAPHKNVCKIECPERRTIEDNERDQVDAHKIEEDNVGKEEDIIQVEFEMPFA